jgi:hypothetical protein
MRGRAEAMLAAASPSPTALQQRSRSIIDYIASEHSSSFDSLYKDRYTSLAVFRSLPSLARLYILRSLPFASRSHCPPAPAFLPA